MVISFPRSFLEEDGPAMALDELLNKKRGK